MPLELHITGPPSDPKKWSPHYPKILSKTYFNIILPLMADFLEVFKTAFQISKGMWNPQYNTQQETVKWNFRILFVAINGLKAWAATNSPPPLPKPYLTFSIDCYHFWNFVLYIYGLLNFNTDFFSSINSTHYTCLNTATSLTFHTTHTVLQHHHTSLLSHHMKQGTSITSICTT